MTIESKALVDETAGSNGCLDRGEGNSDSFLFRNFLGQKTVEPTPQNSKSIRLYKPINPKPWTPKP